MMFKLIHKIETNGKHARPLLMVCKVLRVAFRMPENEVCRFSELVYM